jgi:ubiquinone/menaquinone biosynthesis C-methylase UbiE
MARTNPNFGIDAPPVLAVFAGVTLVGVVLAFVPQVPFAFIPFLVIGVGTLALMLHSSLRGKVVTRDRLLDRVGVRAGESVLDLGCGSGLMLLGAVSRGSDVTGVGVDLWRTVDQVGSDPEHCMDNARLLGVAGRVKLVNADMSALPLPDDSADLVTACLAIHNIHDEDARRRTLAEAARVLRPGGRLAIIDFAKTGEYVRFARAAGFVDVRRSGYSLRMYPPVRTVTARLRDSAVSGS